MVSYVNQAGFVLMVIPSQKILHRAQRHIAGGHRDVRVPAEVVRSVDTGWDEVSRPLFRGHPLLASLTVVDAVVSTLTKRKVANGSLGMIRHVVHIGREETLIQFMSMNTNVSPPKKSLREACAIVEPDLEFNVRSPGIEADSVHAFQPIHGIMIATPDRLRAVKMFLDLCTYGHESGRTVMLWPVKLHPA